MGGLVDKPFTLTRDAGDFEITNFDSGNNIIVVDQSKELKPSE